MNKTLWKVIVGIWIAITIIQIVNLYILFMAQRAGMRNPVVNCSIREDYKRSQSPEWLYKTQTSAVTDWSTQTCYKVYNLK